MNPFLRLEAPFVVRVRDPRDVAMYRQSPVWIRKSRALLYALVSSRPGGIPFATADDLARLLDATEIDDAPVPAVATWGSGEVAATWRAGNRIVLVRSGRGRVIVSARDRWADQPGVFAHRDRDGQPTSVMVGGTVARLRCALGWMDVDCLGFDLCELNMAAESCYPN